MSGYDPLWGEFSPGIFLFLSILEDLREENIKIIDFGCRRSSLNSVWEACGGLNQASNLCANDAWSSVEPVADGDSSRD